LNDLIAKIRKRDVGDGLIVISHTPNRPHYLAGQTIGINSIVIKHSQCESHIYRIVNRGNWRTLMMAAEALSYEATE
jgi:hypothetical protein